MKEGRQLWTPQAWMGEAALREVADAPADAGNERSAQYAGDAAVVVTDARPDTQKDVEDADTLPMQAVSNFPTPDVISPDLPASPSSLRSVGALKPSVPRPQVRWAASMLTVFVLLLTNSVLQINRRPLDVLSEHFPDAALARVQRCESLGHVPDVLYMGSSLTMHAVIPTTVDATVRAQTGKQILSCNVAEDGSTFEEDYYTLKRVITDGFAPRLIVETLWEYNVDSHASPPADTYGLPAEQILSLADLSDVGDLGKHFGSGVQGKLAEVNFVGGKAIPFYGDRLAILKSLCGHSTVGPCAQTVSASVIASPLQKMVLPSDGRGWVALVGRSLETYTTAQLRPYTSCGNRCPAFVIGGHQPGFLSSLITLARAHHIRVALVIPPFSPYFFNVLRPADWQALVSLWQSFAGAPDVSLYDESHDPVYHITDFWDVHHLDADGAARFSVWVGRSLVPQELAGEWTGLVIPFLFVHVGAR